MNETFVLWFSSDFAEFVFAENFLSVLADQKSFTHF